MNKIVILSIALLGLVASGLSSAPLAHAQAPSQQQDITLSPTDAAAQAPPKQTFMIGKITEVKKDEQQTALGATQRQQMFSVRLVTGPDKHKTVDVNFQEIAMGNSSKLGKGSYVVLVKLEQGGQTAYQLVDKFRFPALALGFVLVLILLIWLARWRGAAMVASILLAILFIARSLVPNILTGSHAMLAATAGAILILIITSLLVFGHSKKHLVGLGSSIVSLVVLFLLSYAGAYLSHLGGLGTQESFLVESGLLAQNNLQALLFASFMIGVIGILLPLCMKVVKKTLRGIDEGVSGFKNLFWSGLKHSKKFSVIAVGAFWFVNIGMTFPLYSLFSKTAQQPAWLLINSEFISQELMRGLLGSLILLLAIPISAAIAAWYYSRTADATRTIDSGPDGEPVVTIIEETVILENPNASVESGS